MDDFEHIGCIKIILAGKIIRTNGPSELGHDGGILSLVGVAKKYVQAKDLVGDRAIRCAKANAKNKPHLIAPSNFSLTV